VVEIVAVADGVRNSGGARSTVEVPFCGAGLCSRGSAAAAWADSAVFVACAEDGAFSTIRLFDLSTIASPARMASSGLSSTQAWQLHGMDIRLREVVAFEEQRFIRRNR
jgi:hypothetical protein